MASAEHIAYKPTKAAIQVDLTEETLEFLHEVLEDIFNATSFAHDGEEIDNLDTLIDEKRGEDFLSHVNGSAAGWRREEDSYGKKLYKILPWGQNAHGNERAYRITIVVRPNGEVKLDIREWVAY